MQKRLTIWPKKRPVAVSNREVQMGRSSDKECGTLVCFGSAAIKSVGAKDAMEERRLVGNRAFLDDDGV